MIEKLGGFDSLNGFLAVYAFDPSEFWQDVITAIDLHWRGQYGTFDAQAGREYQIKIAVQETNDMVFRLTASDAPVFRLQPRTQTVSSNASVLFTAWAFGLKPLQYQWRYRGTDVPDATNAMLPIYSANFTNAGEYCVVVSSAAGGVSTSEVARLIISTNDPTPSVRAVQSVGGTNFVFRVNGEEGRSYLVESSTNLVDWLTPLKRFVVVNTNQINLFQIPQDVPKQFFRLSPYYPHNEICDLNMRQLRMAAWCCAEDDHLDDDSNVTGNDVLRYLWTTMLPSCPEDPDQLGYTSYPIETVRTTPSRCFFGHKLERPPLN